MKIVNFILIVGTVYCASCLKSHRLNSIPNKPTAIDTILQVSKNCFEEELNLLFKNSICSEIFVRLGTLELNHKDIKYRNGHYFYDTIQFFLTKVKFDTIVQDPFNDSFFTIKYKLYSSNNKPCYYALTKENVAIYNSDLPITLLLLVRINRKSNYLESIHYGRGCIYKRGNDFFNSTKNGSNDGLMPPAQCILEKLPLIYK